jgi:hypothetical protein
LLPLLALYHALGLEGNNECYNRFMDIEGTPHFDKTPYFEAEPVESEEFKEPFPGGYKSIQNRVLEMIDQKIELSEDDRKDAKEMLSEPYVLYKADQNNWKQRIELANDANEMEEELAGELRDSVLNLN